MHIASHPLFFLITSQSGHRNICSDRQEKQVYNIKKNMIIIRRRKKRRAVKVARFLLASEIGVL